MISFKEMVLTTTFMAAGTLSLSCVLAYGRAEHALESQGYRSVDVRPTGLSHEKGYLFENDFVAKTAAGSPVTGKIHQNRYGDHVKVEI